MRHINFLLIAFFLFLMACTSSEQEQKADTPTNTSSEEAYGLLLLAGGHSFWFEYSDELKLEKELDYLLVPYKNDWRYYKNIIAVADKNCTSSYDSNYKGVCSYTMTGVAKGSYFVEMQKDYKTSYSVYMDEARKKVECGTSSDEWNGLLRYVGKDFYSEEYGFGAGVCLEEGGGSDWIGKRAIAHKDWEEMKAIQVLDEKKLEAAQKNFEKEMKEFEYMLGSDEYEILKYDKAEDLTLAFDRDAGVFNLSVESDDMIGELDGETISYDLGEASDKLIESTNLAGDTYKKLDNKYKFDDALMSPFGNYLISISNDYGTDITVLELINLKAEKSIYKTEIFQEGRPEIQGVFIAYKSDIEVWGTHIKEQPLLQDGVAKMDSETQKLIKGLEENPATYYVWVDNLNIRDKPDLGAKVIGKLKEKQEVFFRGNVSRNRAEVEMRGMKFNNHFLEVETLDGKLKGWAYAGALKDPNDQNRTPDYFKYIEK